MPASGLVDDSTLRLLRSLWIAGPREWRQESFGSIRATGRPRLVAQQAGQRPEGG